ncbi:MAG TPA: FecR family protein [Vicinamibacterales bacterium]
MMTRLLRFAIVVLGFSGSAHAADVGRVLLAAGDTVAVRGNQTIKLTFGTAIQDKDVLRTGAASNLQVRFTDESIVSMRESSELRIDDFQFSGKEDGNERAFFRLLKGGLRTVTGLIGRANHKNYQMGTTTATIGIRGTDYAATLCQGDCRNNDGSLAKDGLYGRTHGQSHGTNAIDVSNAVDSKRFGINENFYVADAKSLVEPLLVAPDFVSNRLESRKQGGSKGDTGGSGTEQATTGGAAAESRPSTTPEPLPQLQFVATQDLGPQGVPTVVLPPANGFVVVYPRDPLSPFGDLIFDDSVLTGTYNGQNHLVSYGTPGSFPSGSLNGGTITDTGSLVLSNGQVITWGRWTGDTLITPFDGIPLSGAPVLFGTATGVGNDSALGSLGGVATYTYAGGPRPVDAGGNVGSISSTSATINFTTQTALIQLAMNFPTVLVSGANTGPASFNLSGSALGNTSPLGTNFLGDFFGPISGSCTGSGCYSSSSFGFFSAGTAGEVGYEFAVFGGVVFGTKAGDAAFLNAYLADSFTPGPPPAAPRAMQFVFAAGPSAIGSGSVVDPHTGTLTLSGTLLNAYNSPFTGQSGNINIAGGGSFTETTLAAGAGVQANAAAAGNVNWGRWIGPIQLVNGGSPVSPPPGSGLHYIYGDMAGMLPTSGSAIYSWIGGTNPTNSAGQVGTFGGGAFNVNFVTQTLTISTPITFTMPGGLNYTLGTCTSCTYSSPTASFINAGASLAGTCSGGACSTGILASGNLNGFFTGVTGQGLITSAGINASGAQTATFAAAFKRP